MSKVVAQYAEVGKSALYGRVKAVAHARGLFEKGGVVLAGVSGGADSVALLRLLHTLSHDLSFTLIVCHLNHNLRGAESERDLDFTSKLAATLGLRFESATLEEGAIGAAGGSLQAAARNARYAFFASVAARAGATRIATAHTMDDVAETMLMRFIKGAALGGLTGIARVRPPYVRPLIDIKRAEIEAFLVEIGQGYVEDSSNLSDRYLRNDIRHNLTALLQRRYNPALLDSLSRTARTLARDEECLTSLAADLYTKAVVRSAALEVVLDRGLLKAARPALVSRVLLRATERFGAREGFYSSHVDSMLGLINAENPSAAIDLPGGLVLLRQYGEVRLASGLAKAPAPFDIALNVPGETVLPTMPLLAGAGCAPADTDGAAVIVTTCIDIADLPDGYKRHARTAYFDLDSLLDAQGAAGGEERITGLRARSFVAGDRMTLFGHSKERKLKEVFIDARVPRLLRPAVALVTVGATVLWAAGLKRSAHFPVTRMSRRLLKIELEK